MHPFFADCYETLERMHKEMEASLNGLPQEAIDWEPGDSMNSLAVLAAHTAGSERYWIGDMLANDDSQRVRALEFETENITTESLAAKLREVLAHSKNVLAEMTLEDLGKVRPSEMKDSGQVTLSWALTHAIEHTASHVGHMQMTRQLWEQRGKNP